MTDLEVLDESWSSALAIVAHPDDLEYGSASAIARWTAQGKRIVYCLATSGEAGIDGMSPEVAGPLREQEERDSAAIVGVDTVEFLGYADGVIEYGLPLRRDIARAVRRHKPDVVITGNYRDSWGPGTLNQADHIAVGRAVLDGVRDAANRWVFRELLDEGLEPWHAPMILVAGSPEAGHAVDVTETFELGVESLRRTPPTWPASAITRWPTRPSSSRRSRVRPARGSASRWRSRSNSWASDLAPPDEVAAARGRRGRSDGVCHRSGVEADLGAYLQRTIRGIRDWESGFGPTSPSESLRVDPARVESVLDDLLDAAARQLSVLPSALRRADAQAAARGGDRRLRRGDADQPQRARARRRARDRAAGARGRRGRSRPCSAIRSTSGT